MKPTVAPKKELFHSVYLFTLNPKRIVFLLATAKLVLKTLNELYLLISLHINISICVTNKLMTKIKSNDPKLTVMKYFVVLEEKTCNLNCLT